MCQSRHFTRRQFFRHAAVAGAAGVAVPYVIPSGVLATDANPGPNDRIGIGYIGTGRRSAQLRALPAEGRIVAMADVNIKRAREHAAPYNARAYQNYHQLLESRDVDAVVIASPDHWHALHSVHAMEAGKDVYVEKPMTLTVREGRVMVDAARKHQRIVQVGSQQRSMTPNYLGCALIRAGRIGKVHTVIGSNYPSPWECKLPGQPVPEGLDWDAWFGPTEVVPYHIDIYTPRAKPGWMSFRPWSGGEMTGWGAHGLDQVQWALGMDDSGPVEIWTVGEKFNPPIFTQPGSQDVGNTACNHPKVFYRYANGTTLRLDNGPPGGAIFIGEKGTISIDRNKCKIEPKELVDAVDKENIIPADFIPNHMADWFSCIKSRKLPVADVEIGHRTATVCHLGNIARWTDRRLKWDPVTEQFLGDDKANSYLDRPRRKPYILPKTT